SATATSSLRPARSKGWTSPIPAWRCGRTASCTCCTRRWSAGRWRSARCPWPSGSRGSRSRTASWWRARCSAGALAPVPLPEHERAGAPRPARRRRARSGGAWRSGAPPPASGRRGPPPSPELPPRSPATSPVRHVHGGGSPAGGAKEQQAAPHVGHVASGLHLLADQVATAHRAAQRLPLAGRLRHGPPLGGAVARVHVLAPRRPAAARASGLNENVASSIIHIMCGQGRGAMPWPFRSMTDDRGRRETADTQKRSSPMHSLFRGGTVAAVALGIVIAPVAGAAQQPVRSVTLEEAIRLALERDPAAVAAEEAVATARADHLEARGALLPSVNLSSSYSNSSNQRFDQATGQLVSESYAAQAQASYELFGGGRRLAQLRRTSAGLAAADAAYRAQRFQTILATTEAYYNAVA